MSVKFTQKEEGAQLNRVLPGAEDYEAEGFGGVESDLNEYEEHRIFGTVAALSQPKIEE